MVLVGKGGGLLLLSSGWWKNGLDRADQGGGFRNVNVAYFICVHSSSEGCAISFSLGEAYGLRGKLIMGLAWLFRVHEVFKNETSDEGKGINHNPNTKTRHGTTSVIT